MGLSPLGIFHTIISIIAVAAGVVALVRDKEITSSNLVGKTYVIMTIITCLTGFGIFHHGGFGKAHVLGIVTLVVLGVAAVAGKTSVFGWASRYVEVISYSATFFFHMIPTFTEAATRLPVGTPLYTNPEAPGIQAAIGVAFVLFLIGAALQARRIHAAGQTKTR